MKRPWEQDTCKEGGGAGGLAVAPVISRTQITSPPKTLLIPKGNNLGPVGMGWRGWLKVEGALGGLFQQQPSVGCLRAHNCHPRPPLDTGHLSC